MLYKWACIAIHTCMTRGHARLSVVHVARYLHKYHLRSGRTSTMIYTYLYCKQTLENVEVLEFSSYFFIQMMAILFLDQENSSTSSKVGKILWENLNSGTIIYFSNSPALLS